jgi:protein involved in polysaccharide export with SLBB domain
LGDLSQDPYLRPGDVITFKRVSRVVTINGEVERPGTYQITEGENLKDIVEIYANGFTAMADPTRMEIVRLVNSVDIAGDRIFLTRDDLTNNYTLEHYDVITVPDITKLQPVMFVEGAVKQIAQSSDNNMEKSADTAQDLSASTRLAIQFNVGETYASLVRRNIAWFTAVSDTQNAYIIRDDKNIPINLNAVLYDASFRDVVLVEENDVLVIPFRQYFITVAGAVSVPGRYPYIPDRDWKYYIALAGGFIADRNSMQAVTITDINGKQLKKTDAISPETTITAKSNHGLYYFNQVAPVITTVLTIVTSVLTIVIATR